MACTLRAAPGIPRFAVRWRKSFDTRNFQRRSSPMVGAYRSAIPATRERREVLLSSSSDQTGNRPKTIALAATTNNPHTKSPAASRTAGGVRELRRMPRSDLSTEFPWTSHRKRRGERSAPGGDRLVPALSPGNATVVREKDRMAGALLHSLEPRLRLPTQPPGRLQKFSVLTRPGCPAVHRLRQKRSAVSRAGARRDQAPPPELQN